VKFIRFAQQKMDKQDQGIVGIITNHTYIDNPTFRGMRQSLLQTFDQILVVNLHGNSRRQERSPDGGRDDNVFDIEQGTAVSLLIKTGHDNRNCRYGDVGVIARKNTGL
jgi:predicted helicase